MIQEELMLKFPHLPEKIFQKLNVQSLFKSREVARSWQNIIDGRNYPWLHIVNIPSILRTRISYLHLSAATGQIEVFETAFNQAEDKNTKNMNEETVFHLACINGHSKIVQLILKNIDMEINVNAKENCARKPDFYLSCQSGNLAVFKVSMKKASPLSIDINAKTNYGLTALHLACYRGFSEVIKILFEYEAVLSIDLNAKDDYGASGFFWACHYGQTGVVETFMENATNLGIDLNAKDNHEWTGFHAACEQGHANLVRIFMKNAATCKIDLNAQIKWPCGFTGFHLACRRGQLEMVKIFMENAAALSIDLNRKGYDGTTAFFLAYHKGHSDVVKILMDNAATFNIDLQV